MDPLSLIGVPPEAIIPVLIAYVLIALIKTFGNRRKED